VNLHSIFDDAAVRRVFPGGVVYCARGDEVTAHEAFGTTAYDDEISRAVTLDTVYDAASVSKLFTLTAFLALKQEMKIPPDYPLYRLLPQFDHDDKRDITLRHLMMHTAGFELHLQRLVGTPSDTWLRAIGEAPLRSAPGAEVNYTCTAYFVLARVIERLCVRRLDKFIEANIIAPLELRRTSFQPSLNVSLDEIAPTELKEDGTPWHGIVHDEAARQWQQETGGYAGNAGVFSTTSDLARFCQMWLHGGVGIFDRDDARNAFSDTQLEDAAGGVCRGWGWQLNNQTYMTSEAPAGTAGHQGFTGPTLFIHPQTRDVVIVLNNRVYPTRNGPARFVYHRRVAAEHFAKFQR
jgi:CubicO group peptidase (beta-lactamase class C family)